MGREFFSVLLLWRGEGCIVKRSSATARKKKKKKKLTAPSSRAFRIRLGV
jgi:hypothetical protein